MFRLVPKQLENGRFNINPVDLTSFRKYFSVCMVAGLYTSTLGVVGRGGVSMLNGLCSSEEWTHRNVFLCTCRVKWFMIVLTQSSYVATFYLLKTFRIF